MSGISRSLTIVLAALAVPGVAWGACNLDSTETNANTVLDQSGHGNLVCTDASGRLGLPMVDITHLVSRTKNGKGLDWEAPPGVDVDLVIAEDSSGRHCDYFYSGSPSKGLNLTAPGSKAVSLENSKICSDGFLETSTPVPTGPDATTVNGCVGDASELQAAVDANGGLGVYANVIGIGENDDGTNRMAFCSGNAQIQCASSCIRPQNVDTPHGVLDYPDNHDPTINVDGCAVDPVTGRTDLSCRPCELTSIEPVFAPQDPSKQLSYCWEVIHDVEESAPGVGTFKPTTSTHEGSITWKEYNTLTCFEVAFPFNGVVYTFVSCTDV